MATGTLIFKGQYLYSKIHTAQIKVADDITSGTTDAGKTCATQGRSPPNCHRSSSCESCVSISRAIINAVCV